VGYIFYHCVDTVRPGSVGSFLLKKYRCVYTVRPGSVGSFLICGESGSGGLQLLLYNLGGGSGR
jgi:hypothetical protein